LTKTFTTKNLHERKRCEKPRIMTKRESKRGKAPSSQRLYPRKPAEGCVMRRIESLKMSILSSATGSLTPAGLWRKKTPKTRRSRNN
jgi:hypothetical protein